MNTINVDLSTGEALNLPIGRQGENNVTQVIFDFSGLKTEFGSGTLSLSVKRPKEYIPYAQTMTVSGNNATWLVNETDTGNFGCGEIQLTYTVSGKVAKTVIYKYTVLRSIGADGEYPIPGQTWQEEMEDEIEGIKEDLEELQEEIEGGGSGLTADLKAALDQLAQKVAYIDDDGQDYYDALHNALYPPASLSYITCVYTQSGTVYDTDTLNSLKSDLVVTAHYTNGTTGVVTTYTLSGTLVTGTSTITVAYGGKTTTFNVTVTHATRDTTAEIATEDAILAYQSGRDVYEYAIENGGITILYDMDTDATVLHPAGVIPYKSAMFQSSRGLIQIFKNDVKVSYVDIVNRWAKAYSDSHTYTEYDKSWSGTDYNQIRFSVDITALDDAYMYDKTTGKVWFAGINTPYYGMSNISEAES